MATAGGGKEENANSVKFEQLKNKSLVGYESSCMSLLLEHRFSDYCNTCFLPFTNRGNVIEYKKSQLSCGVCHKVNYCSSNCYNKDLFHFAECHIITDPSIAGDDSGYSYLVRVAFRLYLIWNISPVYFGKEYCESIHYKCNYKAVKPLAQIMKKGDYKKIYDKCSYVNTSLRFINSNRQPLRVFSPNCTAEMVRKSNRGRALFELYFNHAKFEYAESSPGSSFFEDVFDDTLRHQLIDLVQSYVFHAVFARDLKGAYCVTLNFDHKVEQSCLGESHFLMEGPYGYIRTHENPSRGNYFMSWVNTFEPREERKKKLELLGRVCTCTRCSFQYIIKEQSTMTLLKELKEKLTYLETAIKNTDETYEAELTELFAFLTETLSEYIAKLKEVYGGKGHPYIAELWLKYFKFYSHYCFLHTFQLTEMTKYLAEAWGQKNPNYCVYYYELLNKTYRNLGNPNPEWLEGKSKAALRDLHDFIQNDRELLDHGQYRSEFDFLND